MKYLFFLIITLTTINKVNSQSSKTGSNILNAKETSLVKISALTAVGKIDLLKKQLNIGLDNGMTINEIKETLVQLYAYCGFPRSLNGINAFKTVLDERKDKGIEDLEGEKIIVENNPSDKYEQGRKTLEKLTNTPQLKPAPGFGEFSPRIDAFLKEHLFADIFISDVLSYKQREIITIAALSSIPGVEGQLQVHINMGKNTGITESQLAQMADIIDDTISIAQSNTIRAIIKQPLKSDSLDKLIVRISEIEIEPHYVDEYNKILKEEAKTSVKTESGVVSIFPMAPKEIPTQLRIIEIYKNEEAYKSHLQTPHFQYYKTTTKKMVKSLKLVDMNVLDQETLRLILKKLQ